MLPNHITQTLSDIDARIEFLKLCRDSLSSLFQTAPAGPPTAIPKPAEVARAARRPSSFATMRLGRPPGSTGEPTVVALLRSAAADGREFSSTGMARRLGDANPDFASKIHRAISSIVSWLAEKGELEMVRRDGRTPIWRATEKISGAVTRQSTQLLEEIHQEIDSTRPQSVDED